MKKFFKEFGEFAVQGNVLALAVGIIIGAAFNDVVQSLTTNIISPIIGVFVGTNFDALSVSFLGVDLMYGAFITSIINFIILAFVVFIIVRSMNSFMSKLKKAEAANITTKACPFCKTNIDLHATRCPNCTSELL